MTTVPLEAFLKLLEMHAVLDDCLESEFGKYVTGFPPEQRRERKIRAALEAGVFLSKEMQDAL